MKHLQSQQCEKTKCDFAHVVLKGHCGSSLGKCFSVASADAARFLVRSRTCTWMDRQKTKIRWNSSNLSFPDVGSDVF